MARRRPIQQPGMEGGDEPTFQLTQKGFAAGVIDPQALGRSDNVKYALGLRQCRNAWIEKHGCVEKRPGTRYGAQQTQMANPIRLRPFNYDAYHGYALEVGAGYIAPWALGQPLTVVGCPGYNPANPVPFGQFVTTGGGNYWWCANEQFNSPITVTVTGTYTPGGQVTLTASAALFTNIMCWTGATMTFRVPGANQVVVTLSGYTSSTVVTGTIDSAVPAPIQATATVQWALQYSTYGVTYLGSVGSPSAATAVTIDITGPYYSAGSTLTLTSNVGFFSAEMVSQGTIISIPTSLGVIQLQVTGYSSGTSATGKANLAIPVGLQGVPTAVFSIPLSASSVTVSPLGPTWAPDVQFPAGSPTIAVSSATSFVAGQNLTLTASVNVFASFMAINNQGITFHDGTGQTWTCQIQAYSSPVSVTVTSALAAPQWVQNQPTTYWTLTRVSPSINSPFWYQLPGTAMRMPFAAPQGSLASLQSEQNLAIWTVASQSFYPCEITRLSPYQWQLWTVSRSAGIAAPSAVTAQIGSGPPEGHTLHTFGYVVTAVNANGEESLPSNPATCLGNYPAFTLPNVVQWSAVPGAVSYNIYQTGNSVPAQVGSSPNQAFNDVGGTPNTSLQPPALLPMFQTPNDYPAGVAFYQQRRAFFNTINLPQTFWMSQPNYLENYTVLTPINASSAVQCNLASRVIAAITALADLGKLVVHTASAEYICTGDITGTITDTTIGLIRQGTHGSALIPPVVLGNTDLFTQARGNQVRDMRYDIRSTTYEGKDVTQFAAELFRGRQVIDMVWQHIPNSVIWFLMDNGQLFGLTYIYEQDIWAWHQHDFNGNGFVESMCVIPENNFDTLYLAINRTINGATVRYIERLGTSMWTDLVALSDAVYCDCAITSDGRQPGGTTVVLSTGGGWTQQDLLTVTCSGSQFVAGDAGGTSAVVLQQYGVNGRLTAEVTIPIVAYVSGTVVQGYPDQPVPAWAQGPNVIATWGKAVSSFTVAHLIGQTVSMLGDGSVFAPQVVPAGGVITTQFPVLVLTVGLATITQIETLPVENSQGETLTSKQIDIVELTAMFYLSRGGSYGQDFAHLKAWNQRLIDLAESLGSPTTLYTGPAIIPVQGTWEKMGRICIEHDDPIPLGISALTPTGFAGN